MNGESAGTAVRLAAVEILCESEKKDIFVNTVLRNRSSGLSFDDSRDRAFLNRLCLGTASARIALDYAVSLYAKRGVDSQRPVVRQILRAGAYEILFMDVPGRATVNSYVEVAGQKGFTGVKSFINAVLRKLSENKDEIEWPDPETRYSMPGYPASLIRAYVGDDRAEEVYRALLCKDGISVNIYDRDFYSDGIPEGWEQSPLCDHVYEMHGGGDVKKIPGYREGAFAVQDVSSVLAVKALHLTGSEKVLDLCAAPGGKSCLAASMLLKGGSVLS
ncbi:MAG: hypothetical protein K6E33_07235, partial [Lachnospiraceae bacterium]|nr:hypothetical protein [Lachnospiraceae bacterium]